LALSCRVDQCFGGRRQVGKDHAPGKTSVTMDLGPHANFIIAAYVVAALVVVALIAWVLADHDAQRRLVVSGSLRRHHGRPLVVLCNPIAL